MRHTSALSEHLRNASVVALIAAIAIVQAQIALRPQPFRMFSLGSGGVVFGYGTDSCSSVTFVDSFEDDTLTPFSTSGDASWNTSTTTAYYGTYSAKAGTIGASQSTTLSITQSLSDSGIISFGRRVSSEQNWDFLRFYIDGVLQDSWSGDLAWSEHSYAVSAGSRTFTWIYSKDGSISDGSDTAWIDMVRIGENCGAVSSSSSAAAAFCGNGVRETGEACDDGDKDAGDGCSDTCTVESGWSCTGGSPDVCAEACGDGVIVGSEACDDGNTSNGDGCSSACAEESGWSCSGEPSECETTCGDGIQAGAEACDDGNSDNTDACTNACLLPTCGDGFVQEGEECDDAGESETCDLDCTAVVCGDQRINVTAGEACDDGNTSNTDACINTCQVAMCGDTYIRSGVEQCDPPGIGTCAGNCIFATGIGQTFIEPKEDPPVRRGPPPHCGNGVLEPTRGEVCDEGRFNGFSPTCDRWCGLTFCGDGKVHPDSEECEPAQDGSGAYVIRTCGGKSCTVPVCTSDGTCIGGCRWVFLPLCPTAPVAPASARSSAGGLPPSSKPLLVPASSAASSPALSASSVSARVIVVSSSSRSSIGASSAPAAASMSSVSRSSAAVSVSSASAAAGTTTSAPACGNGIREGQEECDDGSGNSDTLPDACRVDCRLPRCGDRVVDAAEQCDDGNDILGDGCTQLCTVSTCGNGVLEPGEECDEGSRNNDTQPDSCSTSCLLPRCGDGLADTSFGEVCDDGERNSNTAPGACRLNCVLPRCGDGVRDPGEQCDDGNTSGNDSCTASCQTVACGNGVVDWNEACDDGNTRNGDGCSNSCLNESESFLDWFRRSVKLPFGW